MKALKWLLVSLLALAIAAVIAAYLALSAYPLEDLRVLIERQTEKATGRKLTIGGDVQLDLSLTPSIVLEDVTLANASWADERPMATVERLELQVALLPLLSDELAVQRLALVKPVVLLQKRSSGEGNWDFEGAGVTDPETLPSFKAVEVVDGTLTYTDASGLTRQAVIERLEAGSAGLDDPLSGTLSGKLEGDPFDLAFGLGSIRQILVDGSYPFSVQGSMAPAQVSLDGQKSGPEVTLTASVSDMPLEHVAKILHVDLPSVGPLGARLAITRKATSLEVREMDVSLGRNTLSGTLRYDDSAARPKVTGDLKAGRLDLSELLVGPWAPGAPNEAQSGLIADKALPLHVLEPFDADLALAADSLVLPDGTEIGKLKTKALLQDRHLRLDPLGLNVGGGRLAGHLSLNAAVSPAKTTLSMTAAGLDYAHLVDWPVTGHIDVSAELEGNGDDLRSLVSTMKGRSRAVSADTVVDSRLLSIVADSLVTIFRPLFGGAERLPLACVVSDMEWSQGRVRSEATAVAGHSFLSTVSGTVDLLDERLDLYVETSGRGVSLSSLVVPFRVTGPMQSPTILPDPAGTVLAAAKVAGMVMLPSLLAVDLLSIELEKAQDPKQACLKAVGTIEAGGGTEAFVGRWAAKSGEAAKALLEGAAGAAGGIGRGIEDAGKAVGEGAEGAVRGLRSLFGN